MHLLICGHKLKDDDAIVNFCYAIEEYLRSEDGVTIGFSRQFDCDAVRSVLASDGDIEYRVNESCVSMDDWIIYSILFSIERKGSVSESLIFDGETHVALTENVGNVRWLKIQLEGLCSALHAGQLERSELLIMIARKVLLEFTGAYASLVYKRLGDLAALVEICRARYRTSLPGSSSALVYSRKDPVECWVDFFATIDPANAGTISAWPEIMNDYTRIQDFYNDGVRALSDDLAAIKKGGYLQLITLLWLAAYFIRKSEYYISLKDGASAIALVVRALEAYLYFRLHEIGLMEFDRYSKKIIPSPSAKGRFQIAGEGVKGCLLALVAERQFSGIDYSQAEIVINLRNRAAITHGVQRLDCDAVCVALSNIKTFINEAEKSTPHVGKRWANLVSASFMIDWAAMWGRAFSSMA